MEIRFNETRPVEKLVRSDGDAVVVIPLSRRYYRVAFFIGLAFLPCFAAAPILVDSFSVVFTIAWIAGACLFFSLWFWGTGTYLLKADRYGLEIDRVGIRERRLTRNYFWKWEDIYTVEIQREDGVNYVAILLKDKSWKRKFHLMKYDAMISNQYAVPVSEILGQLLEYQNLSRDPAG